MVILETMEKVQNKQLYDQNSKCLILEPKAKKKPAKADSNNTYINRWLFPSVLI